VAVSEPQTNGGAKRGRGRPKKDPNAPPKRSAAAAVTNNGDTNGQVDGDMKTKRGRTVRAPAPAPVVKKAAPSGAKRGRGRPPKKGGASPKKAKSGGGKRGRKPGPGKKAAAPVTSDSADDESAPNNVDSNEDDEPLNDTD